ncbi:transposase [Streptomyces sp. NPDC052415]|uniref:transposase n=1 Tax=Streptomyces sp. NPDC052415 TaxID=3365690 RepID=UPI0037D1D114
MEQMKVVYRGERVVLVWDGLSAHWSRAMRAWVAEQDWLTLERLPAYAPELNPVELLWSSLKKRELANLAGDHLADVADATEEGIHRINTNPRLPWSFLVPAFLCDRTDSSGPETAIAEPMHRGWGRLRGVRPAWRDGLDDRLDEPRFQSQHVAGYGSNQVTRHQWAAKELCDIFTYGLDRVCHSLRGEVGVAEARAVSEGPAEGRLGQQACSALGVMDDGHVHTHTETHG